jgi:hypothetical protein
MSPSPFIAFRDGWNPVPQPVASRHAAPATPARSHLPASFMAAPAAYEGGAGRP